MKSSTWSWRSWFREAHSVCSRLYQRDVERSHVTRIILELCPLSVVAEENRLKVTIAFTTYLPRPSHGGVGAEDTWRTLVLRRRRFD